MSMTRRQSVLAILGSVGAAFVSALTLPRRRAMTGWLVQRGVETDRGRRRGGRGRRAYRLESAPYSVKRHA